MVQAPAPGMVVGTNIGAGRVSTAVGAFDKELFPAFAPLLSACEAYACHTGYRFDMGSFDGLCLEPTATCADVAGTLLLPVISTRRATEPGPVIAAKLRALPAVRDFTRRLRAGEAPLAREAEAAAQAVEAESLRNAMIATLSELEMWPPAEGVLDLRHGRADYLDLSVPLPVVAQRLYEDSLQRLADVQSGCVVERARRKALTSAFIADFAWQATDGGQVGEAERATNASGTAREALAQQQAESREALRRFEDLVGQYRQEQRKGTQRPASAAAVLDHKTRALLHMRQQTALLAATSAAAVSMAAQTAVGALRATGAAGHAAGHAASHNAIASRRGEADRCCVIQP